MWFADSEVRRIQEKRCKMHFYVFIQDSHFLKEPGAMGQKERKPED
jgi:hypothetical protein